MTVRRLGAVRIEVRVDDAVSRALASELAVLPAADGSPTVVCERVEVEPTSGPRYGSTWPRNDGFRFDSADWSADVRLGESAVEVRYRLTYGSRRNRLLRRVPTGLQRLLNWNYLTVHENIARSLVYDVIDQAVQLDQLRRGQSFVHCSAIERDGEVVVIAGWGGAGKTSSVLSLVGSGEYRFLSDDLGIVTGDGEFLRSPKKLQVYPYNLIGDDAMAQRLLGRRRLVDRAHWWWRRRRGGMKAVRRRVSAEELLGAAHVGASGRITVFIHLERGEFDTLHWQETSSEDVARRSAEVLVYELKPLGEISAAFGAAGWTGELDLQSWRQRSEDVIAHAVSGARCLILSVPHATTPQELSTVIRSLAS